MKLSCSVLTVNHTSTAASQAKKKYVISTLALCKNPKSSGYCVLLFSSQNKHGDKYELKNISKVLTRFINEGKATIQFKAPPHDLFIQADVILLKSFLHLLKRALENKLTDKEHLCSTMSVTHTGLKPPVKKLMILNRSDYPTKGFPRTLEILHINDIGRCSLDRGILQLTKLRLLDLSHNCIEYLPTEINNLPNLGELNLSHNEFGKSSLRQWAWIGGNLCKTLKLLNINDNNLSVLPDQLVKLHSLISLHVENNQIKTLPSGIGSLRHLKFFTASNNQISVLPGSTRTWNLQTLDLSRNRFDTNQQGNPAAIYPKPLPVRTLKDYAARRVLHLRLAYTAATIPRTVVDYLDYARYCVCGQACFDIYIRQSQMLLLASVAQTFSISSDMVYIPVDCYFCTLKCFGSTHYNRARLPIVR